MSMISGSWSETEKEVQRRYESMSATKNKNTSVKDYESSLMKRSDDRDLLKDYESSMTRKAAD